MPFSDNNLNFDITKIKRELQDLICGNGGEEPQSLIKATSSFLRGSKEAGTGTQKDKRSKEQETKNLISFIDSNNLWFRKEINEEYKIGEGAEQKVYYNPENGCVIKLNDSIYYAYWEDYFHNLILHNYFFPALHYTLIGFMTKNDTLYAIVEQPFVKATNLINLNNVKEFLAQNGFENTKNNDYRHKELGIILEDLHDENVISSDDVIQ